MTSPNFPTPFIRARLSVERPRPPKALRNVVTIGSQPRLDWLRERPARRSHPCPNDWVKCSNITGFYERSQASLHNGPFPGFHETANGLPFFSFGCRIRLSTARRAASENRLLGLLHCRVA